MTTSGASIEYVQRRVNELQKQHPGRPVFIKVARQVKDKRARAGYRTEYGYALLQYVSSPSAPFDFAIEAVEISEADAYNLNAGNGLHIGPTK